MLGTTHDVPRGTMQQVQTEIADDNLNYRSLESWSKGLHTLTKKMKNCASSREVINSLFEMS